MVNPPPTLLPIHCQQLNKQTNKQTNRQNNYKETKEITEANTQTYNLHITLSFYLLCRQSSCILHFCQLFAAPAEQAGNNTDMHYKQGDYNLPVCQGPM
jgi:hypothetical protein